MPKETGLGMDAFFAQRPKAPTGHQRDATRPTVRTTITLTLEDADRLELLRMHLRHQRGRSLTYGDVVGLALRHLAEREPVPKVAPPIPT